MLSAVWTVLGGIAQVAFCSTRCRFVLTNIHSCFFFFSVLNSITRQTPLTYSPVTSLRKSASWVRTQSGATRFIWMGRRSLSRSKELFSFDPMTSLLNYCAYARKLYPARTACSRSHIIVNQSGPPSTTLRVKLSNWSYSITQVRSAAANNIQPRGFEWSKGSARVRLNYWLILEDSF